MIFITATDTNVGKTLVSSWLMLHCPQLFYWKPIQSGDLETGGDRGVVQRLTQLDNTRFLPSCYELQAPLSPHQAARQEGKLINPAELLPPILSENGQILAEGAGGVMVPLQEDFFIRDLIKQLRWPVLVVARGTLGTLNHTLLTVSALRQLDITVLGIIISGIYDDMNVQTLRHIADVDFVEVLPPLQIANKQTLLAHPLPQQLRQFLGVR